MPSERWQQIEALYHAARECEPGARAAFLVEACAGDEALRARVEKLLSYDDTTTDFIAQPALELAAQAFLGEEETIPQLLIGQELRNYRLLERLGSGGMGEVFLARDARLQRQVAIKVLQARFTTDMDRVRRFVQEARAASALNHPNILTIHEIGEQHNTHYIVTEYVAGKTLRQRITNAPNKQITPTEAVAVVTQIAEALAAAHEAGIVHRDIKPENVMVRPDGLVKVLDFGLAKLTETRSAERGTQSENSSNADRSLFRDHLSTASGIVMGTPRYMSPEQARGENVDARSDLFSLGVLLYEMIAGGAPFAGTTPGEVIAAILRDEPPPLTAFALETPLAVQQIVSRALCKDREARYQTTNDLLADLKRLPQEPDFLRQDRKRSDAVTIAASEEKLIVPSIGATTSFRRVTVLGILLPLLLVFIGSGVWLYFKREKSAEIERLEFKGNFYLGRWSEDEIRKGIEYYNQAIALDPQSASAYEGLAQGWAALSDLYLSPREAMPKAQVAITKALQIKETSAATHVTLALIKAQYDWDWTGAEQELQRAIALDPDYNSAHQVYGWYLIGRGRLTEAQAEMKQALGADPLNDFGLWGLGDSFYFAQQYESAIEQYRRAIGVNPRSHWLHLMLGWAYEQKDSFVEAFAEFNKAGRLNDIPQVQAALGRLRAVSGQRTEAQAVLAELQETARHKYVSPYDIAAIYVGLGETESALVWLEKAYEERSGWLALWLKVDPRFKSLHVDARFQKLLQRIGLA